MAAERPTASDLDAVRAADAGVVVAQQRLAEAVRRAHDSGHSWAHIGRALGISRQAAFKRFGAPRDPRTGEPMTATSTTGAGELTERVFTLIDAGDYDALADLMPADVAEVLTREVVLDTWARAVADTGNLVRCRDTRVELPDGEVVTDDRVLGTVVGDTTLECEAGEWRGRVALDADRRVVGLLVAPVDATGLPF